MCLCSQSLQLQDQLQRGMEVCRARPHLLFPPPSGPTDAAAPVRLQDCPCSSVQGSPDSHLDVSAHIVLLLGELWDLAEAEASSDRPGEDPSIPAAWKSLFPSSERLSRKVTEQLEDPFAVCGAGLPDWFTLLVNHAPFLCSWEARLLMFRRLAFGPARGLLHLANELDERFGMLQVSLGNRSVSLLLQRRKFSFLGEASELIKVLPSGYSSLPPPSSHGIGAAGQAQRKRVSCLCREESSDTP